MNRKMFMKFHLSKKKCRAVLRNGNESSKSKAINSSSRRTLDRYNFFHSFFGRKNENRRGKFSRVRKKEKENK